jgi:hypothetical protein
MLTLGEISKGIEKIEDEYRKKKFHLWVEEELRKSFQGTNITHKRSSGNSLGTSTRQNRKNGR